MTEKEFISIKSDIITLHGLLFSTMQIIAFLAKDKSPGGYDSVWEEMQDVAKKHSAILLSNLGSADSSKN